VEKEAVEEEYEAKEGDGWDLGLDDLDLPETEDAVQEPSGEAAEQSATTTTNVTQEETTQLKTARGSLDRGTIQRVMITPGEPLPDGRELDELMDGFSDIRLAIGDEMVLRVEFGNVDDGTMAITQLLVDNVVTIPFEGLIQANKNKNFEIRITLSESEFHGGRTQLPELISTLTHEWELHGRQFALNIHRLKTDQVPDVHFGHGHFFEEGVQDIDRVLAGGIAGARQQDKAGVKADFLKDAATHIEIVLHGWVAGDNAKAVDFQKDLVEMKASWNLLGKYKPSAGQEAYEELIEPLIDSLETDYTNKADPNATADMISFGIFNTPEEFYSQLIAAFSATIPPDPGNELYELSRNEFKTKIRSALLLAPGFIDALKAEKAENLDAREKALDQLHA